jgi:alpha-beta hydrolase superfamily lysophospholipase
VTTTDGVSPALVTLSPRGPVRGVALLAHGGRSTGTRRASRIDAAALRMYPFLLDLHRAGRDSGLAALQLRYRVRGYNEGDPVADVEWALSEIARRHGDVPVCMVGHSMGARSVLRCAGRDSVRAVVALAPWLPPGESVAALRGRQLYAAHGSRDRITSSLATQAFVRRAAAVAEVAEFRDMGPLGHYLVRGRREWNQVALELSLRVLA